LNRLLYVRVGKDPQVGGSFLVRKEAPGVRRQPPSLPAGQVSLTGRLFDSFFCTEIPPVDPFAGPQKGPRKSQRFIVNHVPLLLLIT